MFERKRPIPQVHVCRLVLYIPTTGDDGHCKCAAVADLVGTKGRSQECMKWELRTTMAITIMELRRHPFIASLLQSAHNANLPHTTTARVLLPSNLSCSRRLLATSSIRASWHHNSLALAPERFHCRSNAGVAGFNSWHNESDQEQTFLLQKLARDVDADFEGTCIFLIGMMGTGKSTVGRILADALRYNFYDSDNVIEEATGLSVAQYFTKHGEKNFRDAETAVLKQLFPCGRSVVATGGGIVMRPVNWSYLRHGITVWLDMPLQGLVERFSIKGVDSRPLLSGSKGNSDFRQAVTVKLSSILRERGPLYAEADTTVSYDKVAAQLGCLSVCDLSPTAIAVQVLVEVSGILRPRKGDDMSREDLLQRGF